MTIEELKQEVNARGIPVPESAFAVYQTLTVLLKEWNAKFNLTAIDEPEEVYEKHILDCLLPLGYETVSGTVVDVGSGAGFPGLVWAAACPHARFTLLEPTAKRCRYLEEAIKATGLSNVTVVNMRAEDFAREARESFDVATARAVANLPVLSELCIPLIKEGGIFCAMKGAQGEAEAELAEKAYAILGCEKPKVIAMALPNGEARTVIHAVKNKPTPKQYPRAYAKIKQKPLV